VFESAFRLFYRLGKRRREITLRNLSLAFPKSSRTELEVLAKKSYLSLSKTSAEIALILAGRIQEPGELIENMKEALTKLEDIFSRKSPGQGVVFLTAHFGNWELGANAMASAGFTAVAIGRRGNNPLIEERMTKRLRERYGNRAVEKEKAVIQMAKALKRGESVGVLIDQKSGRQNSVKVDFFGHKAETTLSVARLKQKFDPLIVPVFCARMPNGRYRLLIREPLEQRCHQEERETACLERMTAEYNSVIEDVIRKYPEQWFWMHNRWRLV
jgi:KDO2-lipid IV(A) lauroyltransferase